MKHKGLHSKAPTMANKNWPR